MWPRLRLTNEEKAYVQKYADPSKPGRGVLRRLYAGHLALTGAVRTPTFTFQISRRSRVFGLTFSGDVTRFRVEIITSSGELHTPQPVYLPHLQPGFMQSEQGVAPGATPSWFSVLPYIFEPSLVLLPNQTLNLNGFPTDVFQDVDYRVDMALHVWEFPGMLGSPY